MAFWGAHRAGSPSNQVLAQGLAWRLPCLVPALAKPSAAQAHRGAFVSLLPAWSSSRRGHCSPFTNRGPGVSSPCVWLQAELWAGLAGRWLA